MTKRFAAALFALALILAAAAPAAMAADYTLGYGEGYYYVYAENGKSLNVRDTPGGAVVGSLKVGTQVYVYTITSDNWALITYRYNKPGYGIGDYACYVSRRFLVSQMPDRQSSSSGDSLSDINAEFRSARKTGNFYIVVRPTRVSGWVNLRWAPSLDAEVMATYKANERLLVLRELNNWYQVEDTNTGNVGFINKQFVTR